MGALFSSSTAKAKRQEEAKKQEMYSRLGGDPVVQAAVDKFYQKAIADDRINEFFKDTNMLEQHRKQVSFLSFAFGKPKMEYAGLNMDRAHRKLVRDMDLTDVHFDAVIEHLQSTLEELNVEAEIVDRLMTTLRGFRDQVLCRGKWALEENN